MKPTRSGSYIEVKGKRRVWYIPENGNVYDIILDDPSNRGGYYSQKVVLRLVTGDLVELQGPWNSNRESFKSDTGYSVEEIVSKWRN